LQLADQPKFILTRGTLLRLIYASTTSCFLQTNDSSSHRCTCSYMIDLRLTGRTFGTGKGAFLLSSAQYIDR